MGYKDVLRASNETVQDLEASAKRRLEEAAALYIIGEYHIAIYIAGLSAEMYLKTACFFIDRATPADEVAPRLAAVKPPQYKPPFQADYEGGHGLWFWCQEIIERRKNFGLQPAPRQFVQVVTTLDSDWFVGMRYRPGFAGEKDAAHFITQVEWIANNHDALRR
jgi:hypothetical protein